MQIIPVVDLKNRIVVHARGGERGSYRAIQSCLSSTSQPLDIVKGLLALHPFTTLYIADLDAIQANGDNRSVISEIAEAFPSLELWVDGGFSEAASIRAFLAAVRASAVVGSETLEHATSLRALGSEARVLLSIDTLKSRYLGPPDLLDDPTLWPERLIAMTLDRVGSSDGPDFQAIDELRNRAPARRIFAAGGVRSLADLKALSRAGAAGALVASALHDGRLPRADIEELARSA